MAQHDYVIANGTGAAVRSDLNNALAAIVSNNSGATEPATMYAYQWWADTSTGLLKLRNAANNAWITLRELDGTLTIEDGTASSPGLAFADDLNTGIYSPSADQLGITTGGTVRLTTTTTGITSALPVDVPLGTASAPTVTFTGDLNTGIYSPGADQVAISTNGTGRLFVNSSGSVGIGTSSPGWLLSVRQDSSSGAAGAYPVVQINNPNATGFAGLYLNDSTAQAGLETRRDTAHLGFYAGGAERARFNSSGQLGIGTTAPDTKLDVRDDSEFGILTVRRSTSPTVNMGFGINSAQTESAINYQTSAGLKFTQSGSERARLDGSGRLLVGTSSSSADVRAIIQGRSGGDPTGQGVLQIQRGSSGVGSLNAGAGIGHILFGDSGGNIAGSVICDSDGTWGGGGSDYPGRLVFSTTADGASSPTERMRIQSDGYVLMGKTAASLTTGGIEVRPVSADEGLYITNTRSSGGEAMFINRQVSDGNLIEFRQANTAEGTISVSGTTVTYGGGHLARWSQLPNDEDPSGILKGTVMSNLDEMCDWGEEDNEQLNKTKISDVEGDKNVAGVFVSTSFSDDGPLDFFVGMTGDMIIRIAEGVTVERGDLLMSAGDGTAKPQDDDIIRSKTIAKVTSTNVSCTYEDGSYCVPCVLMAC